MNPLTSRRLQATNPRVFISYRRDDSPGHSGRLYDALSGRYGPDQVYMDLDTVNTPLGGDYRARIRETVRSCKLLVAVIGRRWLTLADAHGRRRIDLDGDLVRQEIAAALELGIPVVPALVQGAEMPNPTELPESLAGLPDREAIELSDGRWHYDLGRLMVRIDDVLQVPRSGDTTFRPAIARRQPSNWTRPLQLATSTYFLLLGIATLHGLSFVFDQASTIRGLEPTNPGLTHHDLEALARWVSVTVLVAGVGLPWFLAFGSYRGWRWVFWVALFLLLGANAPYAFSGPGWSTVTEDLATIVDHLSTYALAVGGLALFVWMVVGLVRFGPGAWCTRKST